MANRLIVQATVCSPAEEPERERASMGTHKTHGKAQQIATLQTALFMACRISEMTLLTANQRGYWSGLSSVSKALC